MAARREYRRASDKLIYKSEATLKKEVLKAIAEIVKDKAFIYIPNEKYRSGVPDLLLCIYGQFVAIELKVGYNALTEIQKATLDMIAKAVGYVYVMRYNTRLDKDKRYMLNEHGFANASEACAYMVSEVMNCANRNISNYSADFLLERGVAVSGEDYF